MLTCLTPASATKWAGKSDCCLLTRGLTVLPDARGSVCLQHADRSCSCRHLLVANAAVLAMDDSWIGTQHSGRVAQTLVQHMQQETLLLLLQPVKSILNLV